MPASYWSHALRSTVSRRRALAYAGSAGAAAALLAACGSGSGKDTAKKDSSGLTAPIVDDLDKAQRGGVLKFFHPYDQQTFDPFFVSNPNLTPTNMVYGQLWFYPGGHQQRNAGVIEGDIAASWEHSPDKTQITVKVTDKARFSPIAPTNGRAVNAQDVVYSWERYKATSSRRTDLSNQHNPDAPLVSITAVDNQTLLLKLSEPNAIVSYIGLGQAGGLNIVPTESEDTNALDLRRTQNGTGPWYLENYTPSVNYTYKRNPGFKQDKRGLPLADQVDMPIVTEYAQQLAQFKAGSIYGFHTTSETLRGEDILPTKRAVPKLELNVADLKSAGVRVFWGWQPESPFRDERLRQAWNMSIDRDLFIEALNNVKDFEAEGLPMETAWDSALPCDAWTGWWLDPKGKDFGPNAKYFTYDIAEAKKLLAAAGFANGIDANFYYPATGYTNIYYKALETAIGMAQEAGIRAKQKTLNFNTEWRPQVFDTKGHFDGAGFALDGSGEPVAFFAARYGSKGSQFHGFDPDGKSTYAGDPFLEDLMLKMRREFDEKKRIQLALDFQRYEAKKLYYPRLAGGASTFDLAWPAVRGRGVWQGSSSRLDATLWVDKTKAPFVA